MILSGRPVPPTLVLIEGSGGDIMAHDVRPSTWSRPGKAGDELRDRINWGLESAMAKPVYDGLPADLNGEPVPTARYLAVVPSDSKRGIFYAVRVAFHRPGAGAPHGHVTAVHDGFGCEAHDARVRCWHLDCGLAAVVRDYGETLPNGGKIGERERPAVSTAPAGRPAPDRRPTGTDPWGLD